MRSCYNPFMALFHRRSTINWPISTSGVLKPGRYSTMLLTSKEDIEIGQINYFNFEGTERAGTSLTMAEVGILTTILHELAASIEQNHHGLHLACYAKFSTFIDSAAQIEVQ